MNCSISIGRLRKDENEILTFHLAFRMFTLEPVLIESENEPMEAYLRYLYAVLGWAVWCTLHSALISITVTEYMKRKLGDRFRYYRLSYNIVSLATLLPLVSYSLSTRGESIFRWEGPLVIVEYLLLAASLFLFIAGGRHYSMSQFLGICQIRLDCRTVPSPSMIHSSHRVSTG